MICPGCHQSFTFYGFDRHLRQTTQPHCRAVYEARLATSQSYHAELENESSQMEVSDNDADNFSQTQECIAGPSGIPVEKQDDDESDMDEAEEEAEIAETAFAWEPETDMPIYFESDSDEETQIDETEEETADRAKQIIAEHKLAGKPVVVVPYGGRAGETRTKRETEANEEYAEKLAALGEKSSGESSIDWTPFTSEMDWKIAQWAKVHNVSASALTELLSMDNFANHNELSYSTAGQLNTIIDKSLPSPRPQFHEAEIEMGGESFGLYHRDVLECIKALYGDPEFAHQLLFQPECHYADKDQTIRMYHEMNTGKWWWETQKVVEAQTPGATILPLIISTDKTQLTLFRNKSAYPVYMSLGNIPKRIRRQSSKQAYILLGYLPTSGLKHYTNKASRRRALANLFHACMKFILEPLEKAGKEGIEMRSGDGAIRRCHPILAAFVGDYPEQMLLLCLKNNRCAQCTAKLDAFGTLPNKTEQAPRWNLQNIKDALSLVDSENPSDFVHACDSAGIKPVQYPFWEGLPYTNPYISVTPDILHQLLQGVVKHVKSWVLKACGSTEIDARYRRFPLNHDIQHFIKGISSLSRVSGKEHKQIAQLLLGIVIDMPLLDGQPNPKLIRTVRAILDFLELSQLPVHTTQSLTNLHNALVSFHENKDVFIDLGIRAHFNIPKLHFLIHYVPLIQLFGSTDNYNTEYTERLHIDLAKDAYRSTNHKNEYPQMTLWLERKEKILRFEKYIIWQQTGRPSPPLHTQSSHQSHLCLQRSLKMTKYPTVNAVTIAQIKAQYKAPLFEVALLRFIALGRDPNLRTMNAVDQRASMLSIPFSTLPVYHKAKFASIDQPSVTVDSIHANPAREDRRGKPVPHRFDTVLVDMGRAEQLFGVKGCRVAQIRVIFSFPEHALLLSFPNGYQPPKYLAYVEFFTAFAPRPDPNSRLYKVSRALENGERVCSIVPLDDLITSIHLYPKWGGNVPRYWSSSNILDECSAFFVNCFANRFSYMTLV